MVLPSRRNAYFYKKWCSRRGETHIFSAWEALASKIGAPVEAKRSLSHFGRHLGVWNLVRACSHLVRACSALVRACSTLVRACLNLVQARSNQGRARSNRGSRTLEPGSSTLEPGSSTLEPGSSVLERGSSVLEPRRAGGSKWCSRRGETFTFRKSCALVEARRTFSHLGKFWRLKSVLPSRRNAHFHMLGAILKYRTWFEHARTRFERARRWFERARRWFERV